MTANATLPVPIMLMLFSLGPLFAGNSVASSRSVATEVDAVTERVGDAMSALQQCPQVQQFAKHGLLRADSEKRVIVFTRRDSFRQVEWIPRLLKFAPYYPYYLKDCSQVEYSLAVLASELSVDSVADQKTKVLLATLRMASGDVKRATELLDYLVARDNGAALYVVGVSLFDFNEQLGIDYIRRAVDMGYPPAQAVYATLARERRYNVELEESEMERLLRDAYENGERYASPLGLLAFDTKKDLPEKLELARQAAEAGNRSAKVTLARLLIDEVAEDRQSEVVTQLESATLAGSRLGAVLLLDVLAGGDSGILGSRERLSDLMDEGKAVSWYCEFADELRKAITVMEEVKCDE